jgi:ParB/RepB/Spo0J family partition protein
VIWVEAARIIPVDQIHISKMNVRYGIPFGESEEDKALTESVRKGKIVQPFKMRPEGNGFGVYVGGRRFQAKKLAGTQKFVERQDMTINQVDDDQAREESIVENLELFRKNMDPWTRAKGLQQIIDLGVGLSQRTIAKALGIPHSTFTEYISILQLHGNWDRLIREGKLDFYNSLKLVKLKLGELQEEELAKVLDVEGLDAYYAALAKITGGKVERRGVPRGKYVVIRTTLEKRSKDDMKLFEGLEKLAKARNQQVNEYAKDVLREHVKKALL